MINLFPDRQLILSGGADAHRLQNSNKKGEPKSSPHPDYSRTGLHRNIGGADQQLATRCQRRACAMSQR